MTHKHNRFYVYAFFRKDGTPYYIGKGEGRRINRPTGRRFKLPPKDQRKILVGGLTEAEAFEYEIALISLLGRKDQGTGCLRNFTDGGDGASGCSPSAETRAKLSAAVSAALKGRTFSAEHRANLSAAKSNQSPETRARIGAASKGRKPSPETRAKISAAVSAALKGRKPSPETRAKLSAAKSNQSPETRAKIGAAGKGRIFSPEARAKISAALAAHHAANRAQREALSGQLALL
jgi:hypothetical protein